MADNNTVQITIEHVVAKLDEIQKSIDAHRQLGSETSELQGQFDALDRKLNSLKGLQEQARELQNLQKEMGAAEAVAQRLADRQETLRKSVDIAARAQLNAATSHAAQASAVADLDAKISGHKATVAALKEAQTQNTAQIRAATAAYGAESSEVEALRRKGDELKQSIAEQKTAEAETITVRVRARQSEAELGEALKARNNYLDAAQKALKENQAATQKNAEVVTTLGQRIAELGGQLKTGGVNTAALTDEQKRLEAELEKTRTGIDRFGNEVEQSLNKAGRKSQWMGALFEGLGNIGAQVFQAATQAVRNFITGLGAAFSENEKFERTLQRVSGSAGDYAKNLELVGDVSEQLGFVDDDLATSFERLKNAGLDPAAGGLRDVATIAKALGGEQERLAAITDLYAGAITRGVVNAKVFNSAAEQQVPLLEAMAQVLGKSTDETLRLAQAGQLTAADLKAAFAQMAAGMQQSAAAVDDSWAGAVQRSKKALDDFTDAATNSGLQEKIIGLFSSLGESSSSAADAVKDAGARIGGVMQAIVGPIDAAAGVIRGVFNAITAAGNVAVGALTHSFADLFTVIDRTPLLGRALRALGVDLGAVAENLRAVSEGAFERMKQDGADVEASLVQVGRGMTTFGAGVEDTFLGLESASGTATEALDRTASAGAATGAALAGDLSRGATVAVASIQEVADKSGDTSKAVGDLVGKLNAFSPQSVRDTAAALGELSEKSVVSGQVLQQGIVEGVRKLSTEALPELLATAQSVMTGIDQSTAAGAAQFKQLGALVNSARTEAFARLGVDAAEVLSGIDTQAKGLLATFDSLAADSGTDARLIKAAFDELLNKLDTPPELEALKRSLAGVANPAFAAAAAVEEIEKKLALLPAAADTATGKIEELFKKMGLTAGSELDRLADTAKRDFAAVVAAGASLGDQQVVFERYAKAALDAAERRGGYALQETQLQLNAQARTEAQRKTVEELSKKYGELKDRAGDAGRTAASGHQAATGAAASEYNSIVALINARATLSAADQQRIKDIRAESDALRERNSLVNDANRINNLASVSASAASINGRGAVGFGADGINKLREIEAEIERAVSAGRIAADALSETKIDSPDDIREALRQASQARGQAAALSTVTGGQASEARSLAADLERGAAALERAVERYQQAGLESGDANSVNPGTGLGQNQIVFQPNPTTPPQTPAPLPATNQTVNLNLSINGSVPVPLQGSQQAVDQLLRLLEAAGFNATLGP